AAHFIEYTHGKRRIAVLKRDIENAGVLALFTGGDFVLKLKNGIEAATFDNIKISIRSGDKLRHLNLESVLVNSIAYLAGYQSIAIFVVKREITVLTGSKRQGLVQVAVRHFQLKNIQPFATPGIAVKAQKRAGYRLFSAGLEATMHEGADHRKQLRLGHDGELEVIHGLTDNLAGLE